MERWRRVHGPLGGAFTVTTLAMLAILAAIVLIYVSLIGDSDTAFAAAIYTALGSIILVMWAMSAWSHGVFAGDGGIKITYGLSTLIFAWPDIAGIDVRSSRLWIRTTAGTAVETPVVRGRFRLARVPPGRLYLAEPVFDAVLAELAAELRRRTEPRGTGWNALRE
jgi:hypothetical protein